MAAFYWLHPKSCLAIKAPLLIVKALSFGGVLYSVSLDQSKENSHPPSLTDSRHQYGIFSGKLQTSLMRNATWAGREEGQLFLQANDAKTGLKSPHGPDED